MKKTYSTPKMIVHGNFEKLTQIAGNNSVRDVLSFNGNVAQSSDDSIDVLCDANGNNCSQRPAAR
jgi:hypothetical protein